MVHIVCAVVCEVLRWSCPDRGLSWWYEYSVLLVARDSSPKVKYPRPLSLIHTQRLNSCTPTQNTADASDTNTSYFSRKHKCAFEEAISLSSHLSVIISLVIVGLMTTPVAALLLRHIFFSRVYVQTKPRIHKTGYRSWQDWMQMENCGRTHHIRGWRGSSLLV